MVGAEVNENKQKLLQGYLYNICGVRRENRAIIAEGRGLSLSVLRSTDAPDHPRSLAPTLLI